MEPTGTVRDVGLQDLSFSVTDHHGIIRQVNSTFSRLSAYTREELIGAPHNIVRHPMMPGGVFRVMWDHLLAGRPFVGYVHNLAADGARCDVFATVTPLPDGGFLSVRTRPMVVDSYALASMLYEAGCDLEDHLRSSGLSREQAADRGAKHLRGLLSDGHLGTYGDMMLTMLPGEVSALDAMLGGLPDRPAATGPMRELLDEVNTVFSTLSELMGKLDPMAMLMRGMRDAAVVLQGSIDRSTALAATIAARPGIDDDLTPVMEPLRSWMTMGSGMDALLHALMDDMEEIWQIAAQSRFLIALSRLHCYMTGYFVAELIDREPGWQQALPAIGSLSDALTSGFEALHTQAPVYYEAAAEATRRIDEAAQLLRRPAEVMGEWRALASGTDLPEPIAELAAQIDAEQEASRRAVEQLRAISDRCLASGAPSDLTALRRAAEQIRRIASDLSASDPARSGA